MSIFRDKNPERMTILEILVHIFSLLPETLEKLSEKINEFKELKNQQFGVKFKKGTTVKSDSLNKIIEDFLKRYKEKKRSMSGTYVVNLFNSIEKFGNVTADNILEIYEEFITNCENIVNANNIPKKALFGPENKKFHEELKKITTEARGQLNALKAEATKQTSSLQRDFANEKKKAERLTDENSRIKQELTTEKNTNEDLTREKSVIEQKLGTEEQKVRDLARRAEEATKRSTALESALRIAAERKSEKRRLDYLKNGDLHVFTAGDLASSSSRLVNEISKDDLLCLKELEVKGFTYNLGNLNFSENVERLLRDFCDAVENCLGMGHGQGELAKKLLSIADLLNPEIPSILRDKTGWGVKHLEHLRMKLKDLKMYLDQLSMIDSDDETLKNLTALRAWCFEVNSLAKKIKDFLITLDIEKNDSYDYDYYEDEYEGNEDEKDISEYSDEE